MKTELCTFDRVGMQLARKYAIDRIELCQALELGGLTPSIGLVQSAIQEFALETHVLIRPRPGNFCYSSDEKEQMLADIHSLQKFGVAGFVVGALNKEHLPDTDWLREARQLAPKREFTLHRAIDDCADWALGVETAITLGYTRILSSGQEASVTRGMETLKEMKVLTANRIELMCGGGVAPENIHSICEQLKPDGVHFSGALSQLVSERESIFSCNVFVVEESRVSAICEGLLSHHCP